MFGVWCFMLGGSSVEFRVSCSRIPGFEFRDSDFGLRAQDFVFRFQCSGFGFGISGTSFRVSGAVFQVWVSGVGSRAQNFVCRVQCPRFQVWGCASGACFGFRVLYDANNPLHFAQPMRPKRDKETIAAWSMWMKACFFGFRFLCFVFRAFRGAPGGRGSWRGASSARATGTLRMSRFNRGEF